MDTFKVYIFSQESRAAVYGVGTYLALLCKILKKSKIEFALVNLYGSGLGVKKIHEKDYTQINIPSIRNTNDKRKQYFSRNIGYLLKEYTKDKKYTIVLAKSGDNILYADKACDITDEVVKGLNKAYKGMKK